LRKGDRSNGLRILFASPNRLKRLSLPQSEPIALEPRAQRYIGKDREDFVEIGGET
jgi:hypothetical protein